METLLREGRATRDRKVEEAQTEFDRLLVDAYNEGLSLYDLHYATGVSISSLRVRLRLAGAEIRSTGRPTTPRTRLTRKDQAT
jgi:hypothetical protein